MKNVIYKIRNVVNGNYYVGSTVDSRKRFWTHRKALRNGNHVCVHLQRAWNKYGEDCFKFEAIEQYETREELFPAEQKWLNENFGKAYCYNVSPNADSPMRNATQEMKAHLAEKTKAWLKREGHPRLGKTHSEESRLKIAEVRAASNKNKGENHYRYGKTISEETRKKIGDTQRGVKKEPRVYTPEGLEKARENMKRNAVKQDPKPFSDVLAKFPQEIKDKYDFTNAVYTGALNRIEGCVCQDHGVFSQYAAQLRKGRGCPSCGAVERGESKRKQMKEFWASGEGHQVFRKPK
jgi:group I intron endonuclease